VFTGGLVHQYRQIGEAVPPSFARFLAFAVLDYLNPSQATQLKASRAITNVRRGQDEHRSSGPLSVDLFCGAGGLSLGMAAAGFKSALASDKDADSVSTFQKNIGSAIEGDVEESTFAGIIDGATRGRPYVLVGGPPCQGFSQQRRGSRDDVRNQLVVRYAKLALEVENRARAVVLENVAYLDSPRGSHLLEEYIRILTEGGYSIFRYDVNSADYGVAQTRPRILVFAVDDRYVSKFKGLKPLSDRRWMTIGETLYGLDSNPGLLPNHIAANESDLNQRRMAFVDMGRGRTAIPFDFQLGCHRTYDGHLDVFGRLDWFGQARTITGGFDSSSRGEYTHPFRNRSLTAREAARIQGFPDDFEFLGNKASVRRQIGNAVPPPLGFAIGKALLPVMG